MELIYKTDFFLQDLITWFLQLIKEQQQLPCRRTSFLGIILTFTMFFVDSTKDHVEKNYSSALQQEQTSLIGRQLLRSTGLPSVNIGVP